MPSTKSKRSTASREWRVSVIKKKLEYVGTVVRQAPENGGGFIAALTRSIAHVDELGKVTKIVDWKKHLFERNH